MEATKLYFSLPLKPSWIKVVPAGTWVGGPPAGAIMPGSWVVLLLSVDVVVVLVDVVTVDDGSTRMLEGTKLSSVDE